MVGNYEKESSLGAATLDDSSTQLSDMPGNHGPGDVMVAGWLAVSKVFVKVGSVRLSPGAAREPVIEIEPERLVARDLAEEDMVAGSVRIAEVEPVLERWPSPRL